MLSLEPWKCPPIEIMPIHAWQMRTFSMKHVMEFGATVLAQSPHLTEEETRAQRG